MSDENTTITISDTIELGEDRTLVLNNVTLSPDHPTVVYVPIGKMTAMKANEFLLNLQNVFQQKYEGKYEIILMAVRD